MFFRNSRGYLTINNSVSERREEAVLIDYEIVGKELVRFKIDDRYLACESGNIVLIDTKEDTSLFTERNGNYVTLSGNYLSLSDRLFELVTENGEIEPSLIVEYLSLQERLLYKFRKNGIVSWQLTSFDINRWILEDIRTQILELNFKKQNARIGNYLTEIKNSECLLKIQTLKEILDLIFERNCSKEQKYHLTTYSSNTLFKGVDGTGFHLDYPYHNLKKEGKEDKEQKKEILGVQVIFALDDFTIENGATIYIPDSYRQNFDREKRKYMLVKKGSIILYRADIWHTQGINVTDNPRVAVLANFSPLYIQAKDKIETVPNLEMRDGKLFI